MITLDLSEAIAGMDRIQRRLRAIANVMDHAGPLVEHFERIIEAGNTRGVMAGTDKDGNPAPRLKYRPVDVRKLTANQRLGQYPYLRRGREAGLGDYGTYNLLANNNLTTSAYRRLDGPRLAPRRQFSRVISNLRTGSLRLANGSWMATGAWIEVITPKGDKFLHYHFNGDGQERYDLRGIRPDDLKKCYQATREWAKDTIRQLWEGTP